MDLEISMLHTDRQKINTVDIFVINFFRIKNFIFFLIIFIAFKNRIKSRSANIRGINLFLLTSF